MANIHALSGQSNNDLCLQNYGTLDNYIKFLNENGIAASTQTKKDYTFDSSLKNIDTNNTGFPYATQQQKYIPPQNNGDGVYGDAYGGAYG